MDTKVTELIIYQIASQVLILRHVFAANDDLYFKKYILRAQDRENF